MDRLASIADDDIQRHRASGEDWTDISIEERLISENGYKWNLLRFTNRLKPDGPLWIVPHDDENAAFDAMLAALRTYGGVAVTVNSGPGGSRNQAGAGTCGGGSTFVTSCDPNRNFAGATPLYTAAFLDSRPAAQPIIALHTNKPGYGGDSQSGTGHISMLASPRAETFIGNGSVPMLKNPDTFALIAYLAGTAIPESVTKCRTTLNANGVNFWQERVVRSDGSMSNYLVLNGLGIKYVNIESRQETDLKVAADRHAAIIATIWAVCGNYLFDN